MKRSQATAALKFRCCDSHRRGLTVQDFLTRRGWANLKAQIEKAGKTPPMSFEVGLKWRHVNERGE